jgi:hypothetical protein
MRNMEGGESPRTTIEYLSEEDKLGRCRFFLNWVEVEGGKRSQCFFADPEKYNHKRQKQAGVSI